MSDVAKAVKPLFDKFIDFFDIFDLSFFVSGATFLAAIAWAELTPSLGQLVGFEPLSTGEALLAGKMPGVAAVMLILASYVSGMTCFALGRWVRGSLRKLSGWAQAIRQRHTKAGRAHDQYWLFEELVQHGVLERLAGDAGYRVRPDFDRMPWLSRYFSNGGRDQEAALYVRLWAEVRQRTRLSPSFSLLRRYWVSAATLDGLFVAFCTWAALLYLVEDPSQLGGAQAASANLYADVHGWLPSVATMIGALFCLREAGRYDVYQREELVATLLHAYDLPDAELMSMLADARSPAQAGPDSSEQAHDPS